MVRGDAPVWDIAVTLLLIPFDIVVVPLEPELVKVPELLMKPEIVMPAEFA